MQARVENNSTLPLPHRVKNVTPQWIKYLIRDCNIHMRRMSKPLRMFKSPSVPRLVTLVIKIMTQFQMMCVVNHNNLGISVT